MSNRKTILRIVAAAALGTALTLGAAHADDHVSFRDVLKPNGHARSKSQKLADARACGAAANREIRVIMPVFEKCMNTKGWAFDHYQPNPSARPAYGTSVNFTDMRGDANAHPRGDAALQEDSFACKRGWRDEESPRFLHCMAAHGWEYAYSLHARRHYWPAAPDQDWYEQ